MIIQYNKYKELELLGQELDLKIDRNNTLWYKLISRGDKNYKSTEIKLENYSEENKYRVLIDTYIGLSNKLTPSKTRSSFEASDGRAKEKTKKENKIDVENTSNEDTI